MGAPGPTFGGPGTGGAGDVGRRPGEPGFRGGAHVGAGVGGSAVPSVPVFIGGGGMGGSPNMMVPIGASFVDFVQSIEQTFGVAVKAISVSGTGRKVTSLADVQAGALLQVTPCIDGGLLEELRAAGTDEDAAGAGGAGSAASAAAPAESGGDGGAAEASSAADTHSEGAARAAAYAAEARRAEEAAAEGDADAAAT